MAEQVYGFRLVQRSVTAESGVLMRCRPTFGGGGTSQSVVTSTIEHWDFESDRRTVCKAGDFGNFIRQAMEMTEYGKYGKP
jgi:hypothetical protein